MQLASLASRLSAFAVIFYGSLCTAAVGVPENIVLYRQDPLVGFPNIFIQRRASADNFNLTDTDPFFPDFGQPGGAFDDLLQLADINGDGTDDIITVQDVTQFGAPFLSIGSLSEPGPPLELFGFGPGSTLFQRVNGQLFNGQQTATVITRRDFDGDGLADTMSINNSFPEFGQDTLLWVAQGSDQGPLSATSMFYGDNFFSFGAPMAFGSIPLVGDFNGDGIADRAISNDAGLVSAGGINGRQVQIDLSPGAMMFGDGIPDNASQVFTVGGEAGIDANDYEVRAADINGDGLDDIVTLRPFDLDDGMGGVIETWELNGYINNGTFDGSTNAFDFDPNYTNFAGSRSSGDTIQFGAFGLVETGPDPVQGDFNGDGQVDNGDLNLLLGSWGSETVPPEWVNGFDSPVDNGELNDLLGNWGFGTGTAVPEPVAGCLALVALALAPRRRG